MKNRNGKKLICELCGKTAARLRHVTETHGAGADLLVIQNIPMIDCLACGESYFTAETLHEVDRLKRQRRALEVRRPVGVLTYSLEPA
jgi:YgiT-type zinc finger domain-containing protein